MATGGLPERVAPVVEALRRRLPERSVLTGREDLAPYLVDWREHWHGDAAAVVLPRTTAEVAAAVEACAAAGIDVVPHGGNTSLCGGATPLAGAEAVVIALSRMNRVRSVDREGGTLVAEAGVTLAGVRAAAEAAGRLFPLSIGSEGSCQVGGFVSTNAGGTGVLRYGNTRELVLGLEVVLADGAIWDGLRSLRKDNTGYDLKQLFIGAEGTLGIVTAAVLKLFPRPVDTALAWVAVPSTAAALSLLVRLQQRFDTRLTAFELLNHRQVELVVDAMPDATRWPLSGKHPWHLLVELSDPLARSGLADRLADALADASEAGTVSDAMLAQSDRQAAMLWLIRHALSDVNKAHGTSLTLDVAVPVSAVPGFIDDADRVVCEHFPGAEVLVVAHLGDGNVHYIVQYERAVWAALAAPEATREAVFDRLHDVAARHRGSFSAEHGIGAKLTREMARYKSPVEQRMLHAVKAAFDPEGHMNPGKVVPG